MEVKNEFLTIDEIKLLYPDEWVLMRIKEVDRNSNVVIKKGSVLLHGKDYLELCYKGSELPKDEYLTKIFFTGIPKLQTRKWLKATRLNAKQKMN